MNKAMTPARLKKLQSDLGLSGGQLAKLFGVSDGAISRYKSGGMKLSRTSDFMLRMNKFAALSKEEKAKRLRQVLADDHDYQQMLMRETAKVARAIVEQHMVEPTQAFAIAHCALNDSNLKFDIFEMANAYAGTIGQAPKITAVKFEAMLKKYEFIAQGIVP